ncbi:MAG: TnpV protein, partial [Anaerobutyricum hallii]
DEAQERMDILVSQMMEKQGVTEELKARDQMVWVGAVNNIRNAAEEIVLKELVYI